MTTYNTGNPVGSTDPRDLYDNAEAFDRAVNDPAQTFIDRFGNERPTLKRLETDYPLAGVYADEAAISAENAQLAQTGAVAAKDGAVVAKTAAEAARDATVVGAAPTVYATKAAGLAATTSGKYFSVPSADSAEYLILYLNNAGTAVEQKRYPSASATQTASSRSWRNEQRIDGAWWAKAKRIPVALYDLSYGEGVGYTLTGGNVATIPELSGNGNPLTPRGTAGALATFASAGAVQLGAAGVQGYIGLNPGTKKVANKAVLDSFSMHVAAKADAADMNGFLLTLVPDASNSPPGVWISRNNLRVPGLAAVKEGNVSIFDSGGRGSAVDSASTAGPFLYSEFVGDYSASNATYDNVAIVNGFMLPIPQDKTGAGGRLSAGGWATPLNLGRVILGSHTATTTSPAGAFAAAAVYSDKTHTLAEASSIHRGMLEKWAPELIEDVFAVTTHGQSNAVSTIVGNNPDPVSLPNGTGYAWTGTTTVLKDSSIGHVALYGAASAEIGLYFAKEMQRILGWKPIVSNRSSGGIGLIAGGLNGASGYLEPTTEAAIISGAGVGGFDGTWLPWQKLYRKILDYTPRFNVKMRVLIWVGCETDVANLLAIPGGPTASDLEAQSTNIARALENLWNRWKSDIGYTHIALVATGRRGSTLAEVQANAAAVNAVNEGYRRFANSRPEAVIVYDHHTKWNSSGFATDDLVVDASGAWVSGAAIYDGVHYSAAQYKAIGVTGARNFLRHLGMYMYGS